MKQQLLKTIYVIKMDYLKELRRSCIAAPKAGETFIWVKKIIDSCENSFHLEATQRVIDNYRECYGGDLASELFDLLSDKRIELSMP